MRRNLLLLSSWLLLAGLARADGFNFDHLQLATAGGDFLATERAGVPAWEWRAGAAYRFDDQPLVFVRGGARESLVGSRSLVEIAGSIQLGRWVGLGVALPFAAFVSGDAVASGAALGDLRLVPRVELLKRSRFALALLGAIRAPTGDANRFMGDGQVVLEPRLALSITAGLFRIGANWGVRVRPQGALHYLDLTVGHETFASLALAVVPKIRRGEIDVFAELHGDTALSNRFGARQLSPVEVLLGAGGGAKGLRATCALGFGVVDGFGAPRVRAVAMLEYRSPPPAAPRPAPAPLSRRAPDPQLPPLPPLVPNDDVDVPAPVTVGDVQLLPGRIELADPVFFDTDRKRVRHRFYEELGELARVIAQRPSLGDIWIEGHADATGPVEWNHELSRARAEEVVRFLAAHGVAAARLHALGFGDARPLVPAPRGEAIERNRRVQFYTPDTAGPAVAGAPPAEGALP